MPRNHPRSKISLTKCSEGNVFFIFSKIIVELYDDTFLNTRRIPDLVCKSICPVFSPGFIAFEKDFTIITITPSDNVSDAIELLNQYNIGILPIVEENRVVVGVFSERDCIVQNFK